MAEVICIHCGKPLVEVVNGFFKHADGYYACYHEILEDIDSSPQAERSAFHKQLVESVETA